MMKVLFITYYWPPSGGAGVQRSLKFVKYFPLFNIIPYIVTVDENIATYPVLDKTLSREIPDEAIVFKTKTLEPYNLYKILSRKKQIPFGGFANEDNKHSLQNISKFIRGNLFIPDARKGWNKYAYRKCVEIINKEKIEAIITSSPPHSTQLIGLKIKKDFNIPWIADMRDPWTDIYYYKELKHIKWTRKTDERYEKEVLEKADKIIVVSDAIKNLFLSKSEKVKNDKIHVIPNGFDDNDFELQSNPSNKQFIITYTGTLTESYQFDSFIQALNKVVANNNNINFLLRLIGVVSENVFKMLNKTVINFERVPYVPHKKAIEYLLNSTILLLGIPAIVNNEGIITGKLFEYLASKKPIVCIGPTNGDAAKIISDCNAGMVFNYKEEENIIQHLCLLLDKWKTNTNLDLSGNKHTQFSRKKLTSQLVDIINSLNKI